MVIAKGFVGIWKTNKIPEFATVLINTANANVSPNQMGKENARKTQRINSSLIKDAAIYWLDPKSLEGDIFGGAKNLITETFEILKILKNLDSSRIQVNTHNFIQSIELMKVFFDHPIEAVHAFYTIVNFWDVTATVAENDYSDEVRIIGFRGHKMSDPVLVQKKYRKPFKIFIENHYVFTNEGSGLTADYYFSRFDEVLAVLDPEYAKQHGIFFTDRNLGKFAMWFVANHFQTDLSNDYIVFDPAGGSGNLVTSWRGSLKHKIVSELQPDLLRTIEKRMKIDPYHMDTGFTIIPKTSDNKGLNFLDISGQEYLERLEKELKLKQLSLDRPLAFLLNPPYKNTDEKSENRKAKDAEYKIHSSIIELTGKDAGKERYLAFLGQILIMSEAQYEKDSDQSALVLIFTPTSWLIPRPSYVSFRERWDQHFAYEAGFIVTSNEFFKLDGKWPLAFTIWKYHPDPQRKNEVALLDLTALKKVDLNLNWQLGLSEIKTSILDLFLGKSKINLSINRKSIRDALPSIPRDGISVRQPRYNSYRNVTVDERGKLFISGFASGDKRHKSLAVPYGYNNGEFVGFMDDLSLIRLRQDTCNRMSQNHLSVWFRLDHDFKSLNRTRVHNGAPDKYGYSAYDLGSARITMSWFAITKALNESVWDYLQSWGTALITLFGVFGAGFASGWYITDTLGKIEQNELNQKHNVELYKKTVDFDNAIKELKTQIDILKIENEKLRK